MFLRQAGQADAQIDIEPEATFDLADTHFGSDGGVGWQGDLGLPSDKFQGTDKARGVTGSEQLLRVSGGTPRAPQFFRGGQLDVENVVAGNSTAITATGGGCRSDVERFHVRGLLKCGENLLGTESI